jgi:hypothetical protein
MIVFPSGHASWLASCAAELQAPKRTTIIQG